ncbi:hypothetical protein ACFYXH_03275 [Streptomyces sp. NPDC002730]|uniref:hypothetical protein n=1 Tax=Streptomyces sp. NPDC002730 TaxID=3364662 RepID=UPI003680CC5D
MSRTRGGMTVGAAALGVLMLVAGVAQAAPASDGARGVAAYRLADGAKPVKGAASSADGPVLAEPGTYTDTISQGEKKFYKVTLDGKSNAYVSAVLAPPPRSATGVLDGIRVSLASTDGTSCSPDADITFQSNSTRPVAGYVTRRIEPSRDCQKAGDYLYAVEWTGSGSTGARNWPIELKYMAEPGLKPDAPAQGPATSWSSETPSPSSAGEPKTVAGGSGFNDAAAVYKGAWRDELEPGGSRFYKVPVAWGQQLFVGAQFANSKKGFVAINGLRVSLYNTARGVVDDKTDNYIGDPAAIELGTAPAAYANRNGNGSDAVRAMRFQGWYYVQVTLEREVPNPVPVTLNLGIEGKAQPGPAYDGDADKAGFGLGDTGEESGVVPMRVLGITGIGMGTVLVLGLGVWTVVGRRRLGTRS